MTESEKQAAKAERKRLKQTMDQIGRNSGRAKPRPVRAVIQQVVANQGQMIINQLLACAQTERERLIRHLIFENHSNLLERVAEDLANQLVTGEESTQTAIMDSLVALGAIAKPGIMIALERFVQSSNRFDSNALCRFVGVIAGIAARLPLGEQTRAAADGSPTTPAWTSRAPVSGSACLRPA